MKLANKLFLVLYFCLGLAGTGITAGLIDISYSPYTISQPGSYLVVADLTTGQSLNCITIATSNVTIDLNGHTLYGSGTTVGSNSYGIFSEINQSNIRVMNGIVRDFRSSGIRLTGYNSQISQICAYGNRWSGISLDHNGTVWDNVASNNGLSGIYVHSGSVITHNSAYRNGGDGITAPFANTIIGNSAYENGEDGIYVANNSMITDNCVNNNNGDGIEVFYYCYVMENSISYQQNSTSGRGINVTGQRNRIDSNHITANRVGINFENATNWYGRNSFSGSLSVDTSGLIPADPASPYINIFF